MRGRPTHTGNHTDADRTHHSRNRRFSSRLSYLGRNFEIALDVRRTGGIVSMAQIRSIELEQSFANAGA